MKRILALLLLTAASMQANDLSESWNNLGKDSRVASGLKAVVVGILAYEALRATIDHGKIALDLAGSNNNTAWADKWEDFARELVITGGMGYTSFNLGYYFLPKHLKHALAA